MSLELGFDPGYGVYSTWEEYRAVWELHRARFMTRFDWGIRPQAWWDFEAPKRRVQQPREYEYEKATLWENGLLTPAEIVQLEKHWREHFDRANEPGWYGHCIGHAKKGDTFATWLHGEDGRRAHYKWAGIPHALIKKWTAHKRRAKTIRKLEEPTVEPARQETILEAPPTPAVPPVAPAPPEAPPEQPPKRPLPPPLIGDHDAPIDRQPDARGAAGGALRAVGSARRLPRAAGGRTTGQGSR
jgi:hypothetical protein